MRFNLNGLLCNNVSITAHRLADDFMYVPGRRPGMFDPLHRMHSDEFDVSLRIEAICNEREFQWLMSLQYCSGNLVALGSGLVCDYCKQYNPPGMAYCIGCGAVLQEHKFAKLHEFPFRLSYVENSDQLMWLASSTERPAIQVVVAEFFGTLSRDTVHMSDVMFGSESITVRSMPYNLRLQAGLYVCEYCGSVNESGMQCKSCGAGQLPWTEVVKLGHRCLYCGSNLIGGISCKHCGAAARAQAFAAYAGNYAYVR